MTFSIDILTLFAFIGTFQGVLFAVIFWLKNRNLANKIFSLLLLASSIRIAKNIFVHLQDLNPGMFESIELWRSMVYMGISHQFAIGPLLYFYFNAKLDAKFSWNPGYYLHFAPYLILIFISPFISWTFWKNGGLWLSYISILLYFLLTISVYFRRRENVDHTSMIWLRGILFVISILLIAYSPALFHYIGYVGGAILYTVLILVTGYFILTNKGSLAVFRMKYESSSLDSDSVHKIKKDIEQVMGADKPYLNTELTMSSFGNSIGVAPHHISRVINQEFKMNFTDYINSFRLAEAEKKLLDNNYKHLKISAIAFECGFNSVPTFNTLFKKVHKMTPSQYRAAHTSSS